MTPGAIDSTIAYSSYPSGDHLVHPGTRAHPRNRLQQLRHAVGGAIRRQVDPTFLKQLVNPEEILMPVTTRKVALWSVYLGVIAGVVLMDRYYHLGKHINDGIRYNNAILMGFIYGTEPVLLLLLFTLGNYGPAAASPTDGMTLQQRYQRAKTEDCALVIPAHNSDPEGFRNMLQTALKTFPAKNIFVVDNANAVNPVGDTQEVVRGVNKDIVYIWLPIGNKNAAQYVGSMAVRNAGLNFVLTVDDDVLVPETFIAPKHLLTGKTKAASFPIHGVDSRNQKPVFVGWQDLEYKMSGFSKLAERKACGVLYPHGAVSFWERDTLLQALRKHDLVFFGEDLKLGFALMRLGLKLTIDDSQVFKTEVPETMFGAAPNYYQQRVRSWEMGRHVLYKDMIRGLFARNGQTSAHGLFVQKLMQSYALVANLVDWLRVPMLVAMGGERHFWEKAGAFTAGPLIPAMVFKYIICRNRPDMAPSFKAAATFPIYKMLYSSLSVIGAARSLYFYWPNKNKVLTVPEMEKRNDPRCIYLAAQFADDPGFLARDRTHEKAAVEHFMKTEDLSTELAMVPLQDDGRANDALIAVDEEQTIAP